MKPTAQGCTPARRPRGDDTRHRPRPLAVAIALVLSRSADAGTIVVDGVNCTLPDAISSANADTATGGCPAGDGLDILQLTSPQYDLALVDNTVQGANGLPIVNSVIRIDGDPDQDGSNAVITRSDQTGTPAFRLLTVANEGNLTLDRVTLRNGNSDSGGGVYNLGTLELNRSTVSGHRGSGVVNRGGTATLRDSVISENQGSNGGGLDNQGGELTLIDSVVTENEAIYGGGVRNAGGTTTIRSSTLTRNRASYDGGGLYNSNGRLTVADSTLSGNKASVYGGALLNFGEAKLTRTALTENKAYAGGALANDDGGTLKLVDSTLTANSADEFGGGLVNGQRFYGERGGTAVVAGSTFSDNRAGYGGGAILNWDGRLTLSNSTLSHNAAGSVGGAIYNSSFRERGLLTIRHSTVTGNRAGVNGAALYMYFPGSLRLSNSIFANSRGSVSDCYKTDYVTLEFGGINLIEDGSCGVVEAGGISGDPGLGPLQDNGGPTATHALLAGSPAIDAADDALCRKRDQRGVARPQAAHCDIGAFEQVEAQAPGVEALVNGVDRASGTAGSAGGSPLAARRP